jgi:hypothetical protein
VPSKRPACRSETFEPLLEAASYWDANTVLGFWFARKGIAAHNGAESSNPFDQQKGGYSADDVTGEPGIGQRGG